MKAHSGLEDSTSRAAMQEREDAVVARLSALAPHLDGEPDPAWQATTRARLVAMAAVRTPEPAPVSPLRRLLAPREGRRSAWRTRLTAGMAGAAAAVTGLATVVALSADAQPGDPLYGVKRGTEQTQLALAGDARGTTLLGFASTRLGELDAVLDEDVDPDLVRDTLATMDAQTAEGAAWLTERAVETGDAAALDDLAGWTAGQSAGLVALLPEIPQAAQGRAGDSAGLLTRIDDRLDDLRVAVECPGGPATSGADALGPVPGTCEPEAPAPPSEGGSPGTSVTDAPGGTPGTTDSPDAPATPGGGTGSATEPGGRSGSDSGSGSGSGSDDADLPTAEVPTPSLPVPLPTLPTLPSPLDDVIPGTSADDEGSSPAGSSTTSEGGLLPCVPLPPLLEC